MKTKFFKALCVVVTVSSMMLACGVPVVNNEQAEHGKTDEILTTTEFIDLTEITDSTTTPSETYSEMETEDAVEPETEPTEPTPTNFTIKLSFAGDCTLSNVTSDKTSSGFLAYAEQNEPSYFLEKVKPVFEADDFTVVNLECVLSDRSLSKRDKGDGVAFWFKGPASNAKILSSGSVEGVSLANNHTYDYGTYGAEDTKDAVTNEGLQYGYYEEIMYFEKNGFTVAVICSGLWYEEEANNIIKLIKTAEEQSDYQVVMYHGGTEKAHSPEEWRVRASKKLVDNGADLVLGNHPHVLQPIEEYKGVQIVYSLGNFCYGGHMQPQNRTMVYQMTLTVNCEYLEVESSEQNVIPCYVYTTEYNNYQPAPIEDEEEIDRVMKFLNGELDLPY